MRHGATLSALSALGCSYARSLVPFPHDLNDLSGFSPSDVFTILQEIQRTWSYLEPLFIGSEEVKKELPEDAKRFEVIDTDVKGLLKSVSHTEILFLGDRRLEGKNTIARVHGNEEGWHIFDVCHPLTPYCAEPTADILLFRRRRLIFLVSLPPHDCPRLDVGKTKCTRWLQHRRLPG